VKDFFIMVGVRINDLVAKLISVKGLVFAMASWLAFSGHIDGWIWLLSSIAFISIRLLEKILVKKD